MREYCFDDRWSFYLDKGYSHDRDQARQVDLPHDWSIENTVSLDAPCGPAGGFFPGGVGIYEKTFLRENYPDFSRILFEIEGAYLHSYVYLNNNLIASNHNGFTSFLADGSEYIKTGENRIKIVVENDKHPNTRYYSGSGLYRHVKMFCAGEVYIRPWGLCVRTPDVNEKSAIIEIEAEVQNGQKRRKADIIFRIFDEDGLCREKKYVSCHLLEGGNKIRKTFLVDNPKLWSIKTPYLYRCEALIVDEGGEILDTADTVFGIRTLSFDVENGFCLNDETVKLKGGCVHHDNGILGACAYPDAEHRKIKLLKDLGYNAVRTAHNPPSKEFLNACDQMGMLVMEELYDYWRIPKLRNDASPWFDTCHISDMENFIYRDRNHPSIIMWSTGNEIPERDGSGGGAGIARELADGIRAIDDTRAVTNGICDVFPDQGALADDFNKAFYNYYDYRIPEWADGDVEALIGDAKKLHEDWFDLTEEFCAPLDIVGHNYSEDLYAESLIRFPKRVIYGSETFPQKIDSLWKLVLENSHVIGDFSWTAMDYLGEAGLGRVTHGPVEKMMADYPWHTAVCGDLDLCGDKKPIAYYRRIARKELQGPYIAVRGPHLYDKLENYSPWGWTEVSHSWSYPGYEGMPARVEVYADADEVELFLNGKSYGSAKAEKVLCHKFVFDQIPYEPGILRAVSMKNGKEAGSESLCTVGEPVKIWAQISYLPTVFEKRALCFVQCGLADEKDWQVPYGEAEMEALVTGGRLIAMGTADPQSTTSYGSNIHKLYRGKALAVFEMLCPDIEICFSSKGYESIYLRPYGDE